MKSGVLILIFLIRSFLTFSQSELYMPIEFKKAYKNKTRSYDGKPGVNYWQNGARYRIEAEIEPGTWKVTGLQQAVYYNNSPDTLRYVMIKTYPNHYKKGSLRSNTVPSEDLTDGMLLSELSVAGRSVDLTDETRVFEYATFTLILLTQPLAPKDSLLIDVSWRTQIPKIYVNRIGAYDSESAFMGYWYPKIGVYDDIDGNDFFEYLGTQEFYGDFADYDVTISVPDPYCVWAGGHLQNPHEVLSKQQLKQYEKSLDSESEVVINAGGRYKMKNTGRKAWHFKAENVTDFAAAVSNNFRWEAMTVSLQEKDIISNVVYDRQANHEVSDLQNIQKESLIFLSESVPGIPFPFSTFTSFFGVKEYDGMEFPGMANNGFGPSLKENVGVTFHEIAHSYFPFYVGINEVKYSWMEEGWAAFFTVKFFRQYFHGKEHENAELDRLLTNYLSFAGRQSEAPLFVPSNQLTYRPAHVQLSYKKPAVMYLVLEDLLGADLFAECLKTYIERWAGKHPTPYDFMFTFNDVSGIDLDWFWNSWVFRFGYADLGIAGTEASRVTIENIGGLPVPVFLKLRYENGEEKIIHKTADIWRDDPNSVSLTVELYESVESVELLNDRFPDTDMSNNMLNIK